MSWPTTNQHKMEGLRVNSISSVYSTVLFCPAMIILLDKYWDVIITSTIFYSIFVRFLNLSQTNSLILDFNKSTIININGTPCVSSNSCSCGDMYYVSNSCVIFFPWEPICIIYFTAEQTLSKPLFQGRIKIASQFHVHIWCLPIHMVAYLGILSMYGFIKTWSTTCTHSFPWNIHC